MGTVVDRGDVLMCRQYLRTALAAHLRDHDANPGTGHDRQHVRVIPGRGAGRAEGTPQEAEAAGIEECAAAR
ncbi:hypothetical protein [Actinophytocola glycyrrhizae]|uniref:Uncharacterized protein n=1 Tax=Actinophytocola glycyrrhizae TaxID=2044873 RepID=A0ABV9S523_9PSEU